ncbi:MAG: Zn-ribbon domain-containing OB-fold protein [Deltaproteobacteria bacterium]|nr:Zn-ribbon domain-containing OB-fold protein [Deltaproteobacteria bacterium]
MGEQKAFDIEAWVKRHAARLGVREEDLRKAFEKDAGAPAGPDDPFEIPDVWKATYKYSCGGASRFFRELRDNARIMGSHCGKCGVTFCPPRADCPHCYGKTRWVELPGTGTVMTYTTVHFGTSAVRKYPFVCAYVKLDGTDSVICAILEMDDVKRAKVGMKVRTQFKEARDGAITDFVFVPAE